MDPVEVGFYVTRVTVHSTSLPNVLGTASLRHPVTGRFIKVLEFLSISACIAKCEYAA